MKQIVESNDKDKVSAEERLAALIKEAGAAARARKKKAMDEHFKKLRAVVSEAASRNRNSLST